MALYRTTWIIGLLGIVPLVQSAKISRPLFLSPYLEKGLIQEARKDSRVHLPRFSELESYSGFITVDKTFGNHLFFWFFPSSQRTGGPLTIWLNGGPGVSSMFGLLWENGPLQASANESHIDMTLRGHSWARPFSMLYIDNPVGVGYSFTEKRADGERVTMEGVTKDLYSFIEQFYKMFPEYKVRPLYIGGQSYAGKYVPSFAHHIDRQIRDRPLAGIHIGGAFFDPPVQSPAYFEYLYSMGSISFGQMMHYKREISELIRQIKNGELDVTYMSEIIGVLLPKVGLSNPDNYVESRQNGYWVVSEIMSSRNLREAVHVGARHFSVFNDDLMERFGAEVFVSQKPSLAELMDRYKVLLHSGDYDVIVSSAMVEAALMTTPWSLQGEYNTTRWSAWWSAEGKLRGFYSKTGKLCRVVVKGAGHQTPHDQPEAALEMMVQFVDHGCIIERNRAPKRRFHRRKPNCTAKMSSSRDCNLPIL
ncbi:unnamed protein product [Lymnaea stagnalis]|uniref:Uncharacterized protein n=1 Tax=Lymnaea stagnalis TaxID=6523 RepID=A0AAV2I747_LYMST